MQVFNFIIIYMLYKNYLFYCYCSAQTLTTVSSENSSFITLYKTFLNAKSASWNKDDRSAAQCATLSILLYPKEGVYALHRI